MKVFDDICDNDDCYTKTKLACSKTLACGHSCRGFANEKVCLPCLK